MARKLTCREKLHRNHGLPKVEAITGKGIAHWGAGTLLIPAPLEVDEMMRQVRKGRLATIPAIRAALAARHGATICCPLTTGIFANLAAHAAEEDRQAGKVRITPYWRTLKQGGELNPKFPGGVAVLRSRLEAEGHTVVARGKRWFVADFEQRLADLRAE